jgi:hypothetical protein
MSDHKQNSQKMAKKMAGHPFGARPWSSAKFADVGDQRGGSLVV